MRVFVALPVPEEAQDRLSDLTESLYAGRKVDPDQMHVTLAFFAGVAAQPLSDLHEALQEIRAYPFDLTFSGLDIFGGPRPRLLAAMIRPTPELDTLHRAVGSAARAAGLTLQRQRFRPHVTLARFGPRAPDGQQTDLQHFLSDMAAAPIPGFTADRLTLTQSTLGAGPPVYDDLADYPFHPIPSLE